MTPAYPLLATPSTHLPSITMSTSCVRQEKSRFLKWAQQRERLMHESLGRLRSEIVRANVLAEEANQM